MGVVRRVATWWFGPAHTVEDRLFRWLAVLRVVVLIDAAVLDLHHLGRFPHPAGVAAAVAVMVGWTAFAAWAYIDERRRHAPLLLADLAVPVALILLTPTLKGDGFDATIPGFWVIGATMAWAIHYRWLGGLAAGVVIALADLSVRDQVTQANNGNLFLLLVSGPIVGFMVESLVRMAADRDAAQREAAAAAERSRLARAVHDGVLQVLALVQRRGAELGGDGAELGRLAGEQETALRTLIREQDAVVSVRSGAADLGPALLGLATRPGIDVVTPGTPVVLPADVVDELAAAVAACLANVARHVGPDARVWVYVEDAGDTVSVSVRDEGPGIPAGRLAAAAADGRLGVSESITGRLADLGGTAALHTGPHGTEWELTVPRRPS